VKISHRIPTYKGSHFRSVVRMGLGMRGLATLDSHMSGKKIPLLVPTECLAVFFRGNLESCRAASSDNVHAHASAVPTQALHGHERFEVGKD